MRVFITGGSGFVGLNLAQLLLERGDEVTLFSATKPMAGAEELDKLGTLRIETGDVTNAAELTAALKRAGASHVVHMAAITAGLERDARDPRRIFEVNTLGTINALEAARETGCARFVFAGTGAVYGSESFHPEPVNEEHLPAPVTIYSVSKFAAERAVLHLGELWGMDAVAGRLPMVFGAWEYQTGLRDTMSSLWQLSKLARYGAEAVVPETGVQDWMYGPDAARALALLLDAPTLPNRLYNVGIEAPWGLREWAFRLKQRYPGFRFGISADDGEITVAARGTLGRTPFDASRLRNDLGFQAEFGLDAAFDHYMDWLDAHPGAWAESESL